jgi:transcription termination/antitermination protein NusG
MAEDPSERTDQAEEAGSVTTGEPESASSPPETDTMPEHEAVTEAESPEQESLSQTEESPDAEGAETEESPDIERPEEREPAETEAPPEPEESPDVEAGSEVAESPDAEAPSEMDASAEEAPSEMDTSADEAATAERSTASVELGTPPEVEATAEEAPVEEAPVEREASSEEEAAPPVEAASAAATDEEEAPLEEEAPAATEAAQEKVVSDGDPFSGPGDWYVIHTYAGYENKVKTNLGSRIQTMQMQDKIFDVVVPMEDVMEIKGGRKQVVQKNVFPGYLLVKMTYDNDSWYVVRNTPGVTGFVASGTGQKPTPLPRREVEKFLAAKSEETKPAFRLEYEEGDVVRIISGPFTDFNGTISEINVDQSKLKVMVNIFDRETPVELGFDQVAKV